MRLGIGTYSDKHSAEIGLQGSPGALQMQGQTRCPRYLLGGVETLGMCLFLSDAVLSPRAVAKSSLPYADMFTTTLQCSLS